jgi:hypothetical protein
MREKIGGAFLIIIPEVNSPKSYFKKKPPTSYQAKFDKADRVFYFDLPDSPPAWEPSSALLPKLFEWRDDMFLSGGRLVEHFSKWNTPLDEHPIALVPTVLEVVSYEMSPKKARIGVNISAERSAVAVNLLDE